MAATKTPTPPSTPAPSPRTPTRVAQRQVAAHVVAQPGHGREQHGQVLRHEHLHHLRRETAGQHVLLGLCVTENSNPTIRHAVQQTRSQRAIAIVHAYVCITLCQPCSQLPNSAVSCPTHLVRLDLGHDLLVRAQQAVPLPEACSAQSQGEEGLWSRTSKATCPHCSMAGQQSSGHGHLMRTAPCHPLRRAEPSCPSSSSSSNATATTTA